ncbi:MAG: hypothetical protein D3920_08700 [Candidatus Electrothrix sp. AW2]|nr:hypothetical protein [Candidatus Electrothrix gigas]
MVNLKLSVSLFWISDYGEKMMKITILSIVLLAALPAMAQEQETSCYNNDDASPKEVADCLEGKAAKINTELHAELKKTNEKLATTLTTLQAINDRLIKIESKPETFRQDVVEGIELVSLPAGCFQMGSDTGENNEKSIHKVCLDGFWVGRYEVTQRQWKNIMGTNWLSPHVIGDNYPVENISWNDVHQFITELNKKTGKQFRLPTEEEWEYACKGNSGGPYCGGHNPDALAWYTDNSDNLPHSVGEKKANGFGLHDMSGNVAEWCSSVYSLYPGAPQGVSTGFSAIRSDVTVPRRDIVIDRDFLFVKRVIRGGSWDSERTKIRAASRRWDSVPNLHFLASPPPSGPSGVGFRLVLSAQ